MSGSVARRSVIYVVASSLQKLSSLALLPLYTYLLSPEEYGYLNLVVLFALFASTTALLGLDFAVLRYCHPSSDGPAGSVEAVRRYFTAAISLAAAAGMILAALLVAASGLYSKLLFPGLDFFPVVAIATVSVIAQPVTLVYMAVLQTQSRAREFAAYSLGLFLTTAASTLLLVGPAQLGLVGASAAILLTNALFAVIAIFGALKSGLIWGRFGRADVRELLAYSSPMMPHSLSLQAGALATRVIVSNVISVAAAGLFNIAMYAVNAIDSVQTALHRAYLPWYFSQTSSRDDWHSRVRDMVATFVAINVLLASVVAIFSAEILTVLTPPAYAPAAAFVPLLALSMMFKAVYYPELSSLLAMKQGTRAVLFISLSATLLSVVLALVFGLVWGLVGVLVSQVIQRLWMSGTAAVLAHRVGGPAMPWLRIGRVQLAGVLVIAVVIVGDNAGWFGFDVWAVLSIKLLLLCATTGFVAWMEPKFAISVRKVLTRGT